MAHSYTLTSPLQAVSIGTLLFDIASYKIEAVRSFASKPAVNGNFLLHNQGVKPTVLTLTGRVSSSDIPVAPRFYSYMNGNMSFSLIFSDMAFTELKLASFTCEESENRQFTDCILTFITKNAVTEAIS